MTCEFWLGQAGFSLCQSPWKGTCGWPKKPPSSASQKEEEQEEEVQDTRGLLHKTRIRD